MQHSKKDIPQNLFFLGIGGIGMSALARYFSRIGKSVAGYDKTPSELTKKLQNENIEVFFEENSQNIDEQFQKENTLVVFTPAVSTENKLFQYFKKNDFPLKKRAEVLGMISKNLPVLAIAGTHGKTTTTAILAHLIKSVGEKLTAFLGGISENYHTNFLMEGNEVMVVEADEFDRSFLQLSPKMAAITSMDADHLDIYGKAESLQESFREFTKLVPDENNLFVKNGLPLPGKTFGLEDDSDFSARNIKIQNGQYVFDLKTPNETIQNLKFNIPGRHNLLNVTAAMAMAISYGIPSEKLHPALESFKGVKRRFSYRIKTEELVLIDDYAHHPAEIDAVHQAVREMYPGKKILAVFQPHLYSRTRDFADDFAKSLSQFDEVLLLDIYPAREKPIEGIDSEMLLEKMKIEHKKRIEKTEIPDEIKKSACPVIVMMGAGDIGEEVDSVVTSIQSNITSNSLTQ